VTTWRTLAAVCAAANLPALVVSVEGDPAADASVSSGLPCHGVPVLGIAAHLLGGDDQIAAASVAHEVAHLHLDHPRTGWHRYLGEVLTGMGAIAAVAWGLGCPVWALAALAAVAAAVLLTGKAARRRVEADADRCGAALLEVAGMDGRAAMAAMLADLAACEHWAHAATWWLWGHPSASRRLATLTAAPPATTTTTTQERS
jgi:predicted Zn-dependent protease